MTQHDETTTARPKRITKVFPAYRSEPLPQGAADVAMNRTAHLESLAFRQPLCDLLASAYMQGVMDTYDAMTRKASA